MSWNEEVTEGKRFYFGKNWLLFSRSITEERVRAATQSLKTLLGCDSLRGKTFLDVGSGSGLSSLAAFRFGAEVTSVDYDKDSVRCTAELRKSSCSVTADEWKVREASVFTLPEDLTEKYDIVYCWGVIHHTGDMWKALEVLMSLVKPGGTLVTSAYNDQGTVSKVWLAVKKVHCSGVLGRLLVLVLGFPYLFLWNLLDDILKWRSPIKKYTQFKRYRGMSLVYDWLDWLGGFPYEVAKPEKVVDFCVQRGLSLVKFTTSYNRGNNQYVFAKPRQEHNL